MFTAALFRTVKRSKQDFPSYPEVKNPPANAGDTGSLSGLERLHMLWDHQACAPQLRSPCAATTEAHMSQSPCATGEAAAMRSLHSNYRVVPAHCNQRKPTCSHEDLAQSKINFLKKVTTVQMSIN